MKSPIRGIATLCLLSAAAVHASAQQVEPGVQTSSAAAPAASSLISPPADVEPAGAPVTAAQSKAGGVRASTAAAASDKPRAAPTPGSASKGDKSGNRVDLNTTQISGNRELPKVMYVVPWRKPELGDFAGRPPNSLLDEALTPIDRDVFKRQNRYYAALQNQAQSAKSQPGAAADPPQPPRPEDEK